MAARNFRPWATYTQYGIRYDLCAAAVGGTPLFIRLHDGGFVVPYLVLFVFCMVRYIPLCFILGFSV